MALNLQSKLPSADTIRVYDINSESVTRFATEVKGSNGSKGAKVEVAATVAEAAEDAVSLTFCPTSGASRVIYMMSLFYP
jgi:ornithine cyclodeaminase/alanine dehydrogenase-like protein (mu-crystallin family)